MDPLDRITDEDLRKFFHRKKTEMSCMEDPHTFLSQLRDNDLLPEELYEKAIRMESQETKQKVVYEILDLLENIQGQCLRRFWSCVFQDYILQKYSVLRSLRKSLLDGNENRNMNKKVEREEKIQEEPKTDATKRKRCAEETDEEITSSSTVSDKKIPALKPEISGSCSMSIVTLKGEITSKQKMGEMQTEKTTNETDDEEPRPLSVSSSDFDRPFMQHTISLPLIKEDTTLPITCEYKEDRCYPDMPAIDVRELIKKEYELPVMCGDKKGTLYKERFDKAEPCISHPDMFLTPSEFEILGGKDKTKYWKKSICCYEIPLLHLQNEGLLSKPTFKKRSEDKELESRMEQIISRRSTKHGEKEEGREEEEEEEEEEDNKPADLSKFDAPALPVSCAAVSGFLYKSRFSGSCSKSIRTEERWFTPEAFVMQELTLTDRHWSKDILCHGKTLDYLVKKRILPKIHDLKCSCPLCCSKNNRDKDNDNECYICKTEGNLVYWCTECPRAFHHRCHIPSLQEDTPRDEWICKFCVLKANQRSWIHMSYKGALSCPVSGKTRQHCEYLLLRLYKADTECVFTDDPAKMVPEYSSVISKPMWLGKVKKKLQENKYRTVEEFVGDIKLIINNCKCFNRDNTYGYNKIGDKMEKMFDEEFNTIFKIQ